MEVESIFRVTQYRYNGNKDVREGESSYHKDMDSVMRCIERLTPGHFIFCFVVSKLPIGLDVDPDESLSEQVYDGNGNLVSERPFAVLFDRGHEGPTTIEWVNWFRKVRHFEGWKEDQLRFNPGDIVEIHCRRGNRYFYGEGLITGIVVSLPEGTDTFRCDSYGVLTLTCPHSVDYAPVTALFAPRNPIDEKTVNRLKDAFIRMTTKLKKR